ncbi:MAG: ABC transporter permease [Pseudobutyrivibrio sp.]|nr:ABC transporter permease [Pseudobutyrivibrio sp.]
MNKKGLVKIIMAISLLIAILAMTLFGPVLSKYDVAKQNAADRLLLPSKTHIMGTDRFGRDIFVRLLQGGRITISSAVTALILAVCIGIILGMIMGAYENKIIDIVLLRVMDVLLAFPFIVLAMLVVTFIGTGMKNLVLCIVIVYWIPFARVTRKIVCTEKQSVLYEAELLLGKRPWKIIVQAILPKIIQIVLVQSTFELASIILSLSALSFLGLGIKPPSPEWGSMLSDGRAHFLMYPHLIAGPGLAVVILVFTINLLGEGLRDYFDPYQKVELID